MDASSIVGIKQRKNLPVLAPGDTVRVTTKVKEAGKERSQSFRGVIIGIHRGGAGANFTVRHVAHGVGVERTFPINSPLLEKIEVVQHATVRRAKLFYLRRLGGKAARLKERRGIELKEVVAEPEAEPAELMAEPAAAAAPEAAAPPAAPAAPAAKPAPEAKAAEAKPEVKAEAKAAEPKAAKPKAAAKAPEAEAPPEKKS